MKIFKIQMSNFVKGLMIASPLILASQALNARSNLQQDVFVKSNTTTINKEFLIPDSMELSPVVEVAGDTIYPAVVVDLSENKLYHYGFDGYIKNVYPVAVGKKTTPTKPGLRVITDVEDYPYKKAGKNTKRRRAPQDYGPHVITLANIDLKTGLITGSDGQFLHGTSNPNSIGKNVSKGCVRVSNEVIKELAKQLYKDQYVLIRE